MITRIENLLTRIENLLAVNQTARMGRPLAASADHTAFSFTVQMASIILVAALLISAIGA